MLYLLIFILEVCLICFLEKRIWRSFFTPVNVLMFPFVITTAIAIVYSNINPNIPTYYLPALSIWIVGLFFFEFTSICIAVSLNNINKGGWNVPVNRLDDNYKLLKFIAYGCILISLIKLRSVSVEIEYGSSEFSKEYQSTGLFAHLSVLLSAIFSLAIYKLDKQHKSAIIIITGSLFGMYAVGVKSWIIAPVLIGYYARLITGKTRTTYKTTLLPICIASGVFFFSYYLTIVIAGGADLSEQLMTYLGNHFMLYLCSGSLTMSLDYSMGFIEPYMTEALFGPIINIFNALTGQSFVNVINPEFIDVGIWGESNVRTFFGTIYAYSHSWFVFVITTLIFGFFTNIFYALSRSSKSIFLLLANCTNLCFLSLGFFDFYWLTLSCYELFAIFMIMHILLYNKKIILYDTSNHHKFGA